MDAETGPVTLADIEEAAERIKGRVRRTPCLRARFNRTPLHAGALLLKLECLQVTGSFKARGANNAVLQLDEAALKRGVITASGGNHGLAVAYAGHASKTSTVVYLPENSPPAKAERLRAWGARVVIEGEVWDEANQAALERAERDGLTYIHPFSDPAVIAGQGTVGREMLEQSPHIDMLLVAIGGGGLISGIATAAKAIKPGIKVIGVAGRRAHAQGKPGARPAGNPAQNRDRGRHAGAAPQRRDQSGDHPQHRRRHRAGHRRGHARGRALALVRDGPGHRAVRRRGGGGARVGPDRGAAGDHRRRRRLRRRIRRHRLIPMREAA